MQTVNDITLVLRSSGERTEVACLNILDEIFGLDVQVIRAVPFSEALRQSLIAGVEKGKTLTFIVDADVLLSKEGVLQLLEYMNARPHLFEAQGEVMDKFFMVPRAGGVHLYRTAFIPEALQFIPESTASLRPETSMIKAMEKAGKPQGQTSILVGLHDFEQDYEKIFRTAWFHSRKHHYLYRKYFLDEWRKRRYDADYKIALAGLSQGLVSRKQVYADISCFSSELSTFFQAYNLEQKEPLVGYSGKDVTEMLESLFHSVHYTETVRRHSQLLKRKELSKSFRYKLLRNFSSPYCYAVSRFMQLKLKVRHTVW